MSESHFIVKQSYELIRKDLGLEDEWVCEDSENAFDRLEAFLTTKIAYLQDHNFNGLLNSLYRIDIPESGVKRLLTESDNIANELAKAVIHREKQKIITRSAYRP